MNDNMLTQEGQRYFSMLSADCIIFLADYCKTREVMIAYVNKMGEIIFNLK